MPKGLSLHIGLRHVDPFVFTGVFPSKAPEDNDLLGCDIDAKKMSDLAKSLGYTRLATLIDGQATHAAVTAQIKAAAATLGAGDIFLLTFSGHGNQAKDDNGDEPDGERDDTWVLFDEEIRDDEFAKLWLTFAPHVRIVVVLDSCSSGTAITTVSRGADAIAELDGTRSRRAVAAEARDSTAPPKKPNTQQLSTRGPVVVLLSACPDGAFTDAASNATSTSPFTTALLNTFDQTKGAIVGGYPAFHADLTAVFPSAQLFIVGPQAPGFRAFIDTNQPFAI